MNLSTAISHFTFLIPSWLAFSDSIIAYIIIGVFFAFIGTRKHDDQTIEALISFRDDLRRIHDHVTR